LRHDRGSVIRRGRLGYQVKDTGAAKRFKGDPLPPFMCRDATEIPKFSAANVPIRGLPRTRRPMRKRRPRSQLASDSVLGTSEPGAEAPPVPVFGRATAYL